MKAAARLKVMSNHATNYEDVLQAALKLAPDKRIKLIMSLLSALDAQAEALPESELEALWADEIKSRIAEYEAGKVKTISRSEMKERMRKLLNERRAETNTAKA